MWPLSRRRPVWFLPGRTPVELVDYYRDTRHPVSSIIVVLPLLVIYEVAVLGLAGGERPASRNGADAWLRNLFPELGFWAAHLPPALVLAVLFIRLINRLRDLPRNWAMLVFGIMVECLSWGLALWALSLGWPGIVKNSGVELSWLDSAGPAIREIIPLVGAGVYEEFLFRLVFLGLLSRGIAFIGVGGIAGWLVAAVVSSWFFGAVHHWGPQGQPFTPILFSFRLAAGLILCFLARFRGFSIAVGTHFIYNLIVGLRPRLGPP